jgi:hypothetical protein
MGLSVSSFFSRYINHPFSKELSIKDRVKASIASIVVGVFTLGMVQLYCATKMSRSVSHSGYFNKTLTVSSFFSKYINHPLSPDLSDKEKLEATISSVALGIFTAGIAQIVCAIWHNRRIFQLKEKKNPVVPVNPVSVKRFGEHAKKRAVSAADELLTSVRYRQGPLSLTAAFAEKKIDFGTIGTAIQSLFIAKYYAKPLPSPSEVTVPLPEGGRARWTSLSIDQKIDVANQMNLFQRQISQTEWGKEHIDDLFMPRLQESYLPSDPRQYYGSDHAVRMALFMPIFAHLYAKYDPRQRSLLSKEELLLSQIIAAGCSSGRQTEGPNVYKEESIEQLISALKELGIQDSFIFTLVRSAVAHVDAPQGADTPLIVKLIKNATGVESVRLQPEGVDRQRSESVLDIFKELEHEASQHGGKLKGTYAWIDFQEELEEIVWEMNRLILHTSQKEFREAASVSGKTYYQEILSTIDEENYPHIFAILRRMRVISVSTEVQEKIAGQRIEQGVSCIETWVRQGVETVPTGMLKAGITFLNGISTSDRREKMRSQISAELETRHDAKEKFETILLLNKKENVKEVALLFTKLPYILRQHYRPCLTEYFSLMKDLPHNDIAYRILRTQMLYGELCAFLDTTKGTKTIALAQELVLRSNELLEIDGELTEPLKEPGVQTACALALDEAASIYRAHGKDKEASKVLETAALHLTIPAVHGLAASWKVSGDMYSEDEVCFFLSDCHRVRKRMLRVCEKVIDGASITEISFELTSQSRETLSKVVKSLGEDHCCNVPAIYPRRIDGKNAYTNRDRPLKIGEDFKITLVDGVEIFVGAEPSKWNQYHLMRVHVRKGVRLESVQKALSMIGLPTVLMPSRPEDEKHEMLSRIISFRFPTLLPSGDLSKDPQKVYKSLSPQDKAIVDEDMQHVELAYLGPNTIAIGEPRLANEAWSFGARAFGTFIDAGAIEDAAAITESIVKNGFLSSQERFARGILGLGCAPLYNYETGSANQVFTRVLTKEEFDSRYSLDNFAVIGKVFFILDICAVERMPYSYLHDRGGLRNPHFYLSYFNPEKQEPIKEYKGKERILERPGFPKLVTEQARKLHPLNETMFDLQLGPQYIRRVVVATEEDRKILLKHLMSKGIFEINGMSVESVVVATNCLHPGMVGGFYESTYA